MVAVVLLVLSPAVWVWTSSLWDKTATAWLRAELTAATSAALRGATANALDAARLAREHRVRLRVLDADARLLSDHDHDGAPRWHYPLTDPWFGPEGRPRPAEWDARAPPLAERPEMLQAREGGRASRCDISARGDLLVCAEVRRALTPDGTRWLHVQRSTARSARALYEDRFQMTQLTLTVLVFAVLVTVWLATRWVGPIESLRDQAIARTRGGSTAPLSVARSDELGEVADAFNSLLASIAERNAANERFAADLAHELKNPIAAVRAAADALGSGRPVDPERAARLHRILADSSARMAVVIDRFLELARAEAGLADRARARLDLVAMIAALLDGLRADPRFADVAFTCEGPPSAEVPAAAERLETALRNLLENAACFATGRAPAGVRVRIAIDDRVARVAITDTGPGIAPDDLPRVFDRYFSRRQGGTGLGLALAKAILDAHGGSLTAESPPGQGATFTATLPR